MKNITEITRRELFNIIQEGFYKDVETLAYVPHYDKYMPSFETVKVYMPYYGRFTEIEFLDRLYHLEELPSKDHRYKNAKGDIYCHTVSFDDWPEFWFLDDDRFELKEGCDDEPMLKFLCEMLHPAVREEGSPWREYLERINELLRQDGYELYAAYKISGRDIYKAREYITQDNPLLPDNLFSERYKALIDFGHGTSIDNISGKVEFSAKKHLCKVMFEFAEPSSIQRSRYDSCVENTDALEESIKRLNDFLEMTIVNLDPFTYMYGTSKEDILASQFTPFLFDIIEFQFDELSNGEKTPFQAAINASLKKDNVSFRLSDRGLVEILNDYEVLSSEIIKNVDSVAEPGIQDLLNEAIAKHMQPTFQAHRDAAEKIWDALERLKTYYTSMDKKASATKIISDMAGGQADYIELFNAEFKALTDIGNNFRIRHHETSKIDITDIRHYDYFFNRCLSLISTAILYLK